MISPLILALLAALGFSLSNFFSRLGMKESTAATAVVVGVTVNAAGLWLLAAGLSSVRPIFSPDIWPFILAGIFAPCLARSFLFHGYKHLGLARSDVIAGSMPLFAVLLAVALIGERPSLQAVLGTIGIVVGIGRLTGRRDEDRPWARWRVVFPLGAAFFFALRDVVSKVGLRLLPFPVTGAAVTATVAGLVLTSPFLFSGGRRRIVLTRRSFFLFCLAGFSATAAYLFMFRALGGGEVSLVSPLISVFPLFSVFLSYLFLGPEEKVTWRVVSGGCLVVAGASSVLLS